MVEKFSIVKQLDAEKLNNRISEFICKNWYNPYIFANSETLAALAKPMEQDFKKITEFADGGILATYQPKGLIAMYQGYKVFEDSTLDFGEIELR